MPQPSLRAGAAVLACGLVGTCAFLAPFGRPALSERSVDQVRTAGRFLSSDDAARPVAPATSAIALGGVFAAVGVAAVAARALAGKTSKPTAGGARARVVPLSSSVAPTAPAVFLRDQLVACRAQLSEAGAPQAEDMDAHIAELEAAAKRMLGGAAAAMLFVGSMANGVEAYPIFAQQNYPEPRDATGKIACGNCHLAGKEVDVRTPSEVLPDTIFKIAIDIPCKYEKRVQPLADGSKGPLNVGAIAVMPEGWKLAPKDRLPKELKKQMKGLAWSAYSKEKPNIVVAGPVPGTIYQKMVLPVLAPDPNTQKDIYFDKCLFYFGGNRGRGQIYPEGNQSNNNQFFAKEAGTISKVDGLNVTITKADGTTVEQSVLPGAQIVVSEGDVVSKDDPITTNPNVGGFGQAEKEIVLQDMNRVYAYAAISVSIFLAQLAFVLKKKQFEKVQLAEGF